MTSLPSVLARYPDYEAVIGIEVHVQLTTQSKIFCSCSNKAVAEPNTTICQICTGQPGVLPLLNNTVIEYALKAGLATNCTISSVSRFARKHYFYPDLPKGYQITQSDTPICTNGSVTISNEDKTTKTIRIMRIHIEEDAGKNIHAQESNESFVDLNRAGTPLLEIVTEPDIENAHQAREYLKMLRLTVQYLGICSGNMEEGAFRADTNISVRKKGSTKLGTRCELKNINSFKFISDAIEYEIERQIHLLEAGETLEQETRLWDTKARKTVAMRTKEKAADYRYFDDPDLPVIILDQATIDTVRSALPELPYQKLERLQAQKGLSIYEAEILLNDPELALYYEQASKHTTSKLLINWILRDLMAYIKEHKITLQESKITPQHLAQLVDLLDKEVINNRAAQEVFQAMAQTGELPLSIIQQRGLEQIDNTQELEVLIRELLQAHPDKVAQYKSGKENLWGFFVGQIMQKTQGKANPRTINQLLAQYLSKSSH